MGHFLGQSAPFAMCLCETCTRKRCFPLGGGLAAMLLLRELGPALSGRVAVLDPCPPPEKPTVNWSYWSHVPTLYDRFAVGSWRKARVAQMPAEPVAPYILRLVRSTDVFA